MFDVTIDQARRLVRTRVVGFLTLSEVETSLPALRARLLAEQLSGGYLLMIDTMHATPQSQEVIAALQRHMAKFLKAARIAVVNGSALARMQVRRMMTQPYARIVGTQAEAEAWLLDGVEPAREPCAA